MGQCREPLGHRAADLGKDGGACPGGQWRMREALPGNAGCRKLGGSRPGQSGEEEDGEVPRRPTSEAWP